MLCRGGSPTPDRGCHLNGWLGTRSPHAPSRWAAAAATAMQWLLFFTFLSGLASCYFSAELQGEYVMQTVTAGAHVQYSRVNITAEAIPMWGQCHQRQGDNVILFDSFNGTACMRCFHLKLHSPNVLQVHTCPTCLDQCYLTEEAARHTCPTGDFFRPNYFKEITLFRTKELGGGNIRKIFCPITGQYTFMYDLYNQTDNRVECSPALSHLENCADRAGGPQLDVHFQGCLHQYNDVTFDCLGDWAGTDGQRFLALYDTSVLAGTDYRPQYRCALYKQDEQNGNVIMAFSSDSTCTTDLYNASYGHMTWNLTVIPSSPWPAQVINSKCSFPYWSQGKWERFNINHNTLTYKDHLSFNSYTMRCVEAVDEGKLIVFSRNGCGEETYKCIQLKQRSRNVVEFQIGLTTSSFVNHSLCSDSNFLGNVWITQARLEGLQVSPCPVTGEYSGVIPDPNNVGLCARLASDQTHQEIMYFTVFDCDQQEVYEGRYHSSRHQREVEEGVYNSTVDEITTSTSKGDLLAVSNTSTGNVGTDSERTTDSSQTKINVSELGFSSGFSLEVTESYAYTGVTDSVSSVMGTTTPSTESPISSGYPTTYRPNRSFQPENPWNPHVTWPTTLPWYSVHNNKNLSIPQWTTYSPIGGRGYAGFPNNYRERDWTKSSSPFDVSNIPYNGMNYWNTGFPREEFRIRTPSGLFVQHPTSRNYINSTRTPIESPRFPAYSGNRDRTYQNTRNSWNWNGRWSGRSPMVYTYRPYQRNSATGRQPIALPPIQLPPLYPDLKTLLGSSSVGRRPLAIEEREYQCLGQWEEDSVTYTYTQRKDFGTYECFVGSIVSNNDIYIKEAGEHCGRGINPKHMGMKLQTKGKQELNIRPPEPTQPVTSWYVTSRPSSPTRPWKPITGAPPRHSATSKTSNSVGLFFVVTVTSLLLGC